MPLFVELNSQYQQAFSKKNLLDLPQLALGHHREYYMQHLAL